MVISIFPQRKIMAMIIEPYSEQLKIWPNHGKHILAQFDDETVILYQAYRPETGRFAATHGTFGLGFSYNRMSWVKPNFLWMMYRSGWGTKVNQEVTLALRVRRVFFDSLLAAAVPSVWDHGLFANEEEWSREVRRSEVRLQWDPDHDPFGKKQERRAIQLGLRGQMLKAFGKQELVEVSDISEFVTGQREKLAANGQSALLTPRERVYRPADSELCYRLGIVDETTSNNVGMGSAR